MSETKPEILVLAADIVSAFVSKNPMQAIDVPNFIGSVCTALSNAGTPVAPVEPVADKPTPAQIRKSVTPEALISFIDGKPYKTLKRHLTKHGLDAASYRERYGLPSDYPTTSANYSAHRTELAKSLGLGRRDRPQSEAA